MATRIQSLSAVSALGVGDITYVCQDPAGTPGDRKATMRQLAAFLNGLGIADINASHNMKFACGSDLTADRTLTIATGDASRLLTLDGNVVLNDWFDQSVKAGASPTFVALQVTTINALTPTAGAIGFTLAGGTTSKTLTVAGNCTVNDWFDQGVKTTSSPTFVKVTTQDASGTGKTLFLGADSQSGVAIKTFSSKFSAIQATTAATSVGFLNSASSGGLFIEERTEGAFLAVNSIGALLPAGWAFVVQGASEVLRVDRDGNVTAGAKVTVGPGTFAANVPSVYYSAADGLIVVGKAGSVSDFSLVEASGTILLSNPAGTNNIAICPSSGSVGIGISVPSVYIGTGLHVSSATSCALKIESRDTGAGGAFLEFERKTTGGERRWLVGTGINSFTEWAIYDVTGAQFGLMVTQDQNVILSGIASPPTGTKCFTMNVGTAPTATPASTFTMYAHDYADVADKSCPHFRIEDGTVVRLNQDVSTLGLPKFAGLAVGSVAVSPTYAVDIRSAPCKLHMAPSNTDTGLWMDAIGSAELAWSCGATYNSYSAPNYLFLAKATTASGMLQLNGITSFYADTGLTVGATFIPTKHLSISLAGSVMVGGAAATSKFDVLDSATREPSLTVANAPISQIRSSTVALTFGIASTGVTWLQGRNYSADGISYDIALNPVGGKVGVGTLAPAVALDVNANSIRIRTAKTPATAGAAGIQGEVAWDAGYVYVCVATNTWKRAAIATW